MNDTELGGVIRTYATAADKAPGRQLSLTIDGKLYRFSRANKDLENEMQGRPRVLKSSDRFYKQQ